LAVPVAVGEGSLLGGGDDADGVSHVQHDCAGGDDTGEGEGVGAALRHRPRPPGCVDRVGWGEVIQSLQQGLSPDRVETKGAFDPPIQRHRRMHMAAFPLLYAHDSIADTEREWVTKIITRQGDAYETATLATG
jgi:hypothetical protein